MMNRQQFLRRWARDNKDAKGALELSETDRQELAKSIEQGLGVIDQFWQIAAGRELTDEEKGLV